jgi:hypothetical protein
MSLEKAAHRAAFFLPVKMKTHVTGELLFPCAGSLSCGGKATAARAPAALPVLALAHTLMQNKFNWLHEGFCSCELKWARSCVAPSFAAAAMPNFCGASVIWGVANQGYLS